MNVRTQELRQQDAAVDTTTAMPVVVDRGHMLVLSTALMQDQFRQPRANHSAGHLVVVGTAQAHFFV